MDPNHSFSNNITVQLNSAASGEVKLRSKDPSDNPLIDPKFLSNPYDKEILIAAIRAEILLMQTETMKKHYVGPILTPESDSDEDILVLECKVSASLMQKLTLLGIHRSYCWTFVAYFLHDKNGKVNRQKCRRRFTDESLWFKEPTSSGCWCCTF